MTEGYRPKSNGKPMGTPPHKGSGGHKPSDHIEQLTAEVERMQAKLAEMNNSDIIARTMAENERLREALGWYEKQANDCRKITREGDDARYALDRDGGERARAALAGDSHAD